jgi:glucose/arabinose dehydrogenase
VRSIAVATLLVAATLVAAGGQPSAATGPAGVRVRFHQVASGLDNPVSVTAARDGTKRLYVVEQRGTVRIVTHGRVHSRVYLDLSGRVACCGERGLLSIAFHPHFRTHHFVYAAWTRRSDGALQVSRFRASSAGAKHVAASTARRIVTVPHPGQSNHNAGQLMFGDGGLFFVSTGDGGGGGDPYDNARDLTSLSGKILRLDVDRSCGTHHYCVPNGNPFAGARNQHKRLVFDWGLRNPWRMSVDRADGTLWIADVGQDAVEEIDHVGVRGGKDFGWSCREGRSSYNGNRCTINGHPRHMTAPVHVYGHTSANGATRCAVIGGYAYHGPRYRFAHGLYVYGDYCTGEVWALKHTSTGWKNARVGSAGGTYSVTGFGESDTGEIYAVTQGGGLFHVTFHRR